MKVCGGKRRLTSLSGLLNDKVGGECLKVHLCLTCQYCLYDLETGYSSIPKRSAAPREVSN